jgi:hypothetical protein
MRAKLTLMIASILAALLLSEGAVRLYLGQSGDEGFRDPAAFYGQALERSRWAPGNWLRELEPHPYFGFTLVKGHPSGNNFGFSDPESFPYKRRNENELVIGVFGGSVALGWAEWAQSTTAFTDELVRLLPLLKGRDIRILNFSLGGYKQPQQLFIASYFLDSVDLFLNIEGHNEMEAFANFPSFPVDYPIAAHLYFEAGRKSFRLSRKLQLQASVGRFLFSLGEGRPLLGGLALYYLGARAYSVWVSGNMLSLTKEARLALAEESRATADGFYRLRPGEEPVQAAIAAWENYTLQQSRLLSASGKRAVFFLQPNQYLPGSKRLSDWERENAVTHYFFGKAKAYSQLPAAASRIRANNVNMHDLTMVFAAVEETVYADNCCHLNEKGNEIMGREIARRIASTVRF